MFSVSPIQLRDHPDFYLSRVGRIAVSSRLRSGGSAATERAWGFAPGRNWGPEPPGGRVPNFPVSLVAVQVLEDEVPPGVECGSSVPGSPPFRAQVLATTPVRRCLRRSVVAEIRLSR